jgi:hypothetical protein
MTFPFHMKEVLAPPLTLTLSPTRRGDARRARTFFTSPHWGEVGTDRKIGSG